MTAVAAAVPGRVGLTQTMCVPAMRDRPNIAFFGGSVEKLEYPITQPVAEGEPHGRIEPVSLGAVAVSGAWICPPSRIAETSSRRSAGDRAITVPTRCLRM